MNLLKEGVTTQAVIKTAQTRKLTVDGLTKHTLFIRFVWIGCSTTIRMIVSLLGSASIRLSTTARFPIAVTERLTTQSLSSLFLRAILRQSAKPRPTLKWLTSVKPVLFWLMAELLTATAGSPVCGVWLQRMIGLAISKL